MPDGATLDTPRLVIAAAIVVTVGTVPALGAGAAASDDANVIGEHLEKALDGEAPYDGEPYVSDGTATVLFAGPDPPDPAVEPDTRDGWVAHFEAHHEPFRAYARDLLEEHGAEVLQTVAAANSVTAEVPLDRVEEIVDADQARLAMLETAALDWMGAVELANTDSVPPTKVATFHDNGFAGDGILLADIDTGVDNTHECIRTASGEDRVVKWKDFINGNQEPYDDHGHGTHTTATAAGSSCQEPGMAPEADIMGVKMLSGSGSGSWSGAQSALEWAFNNGADVSTNSWGGGCSGGGAETRDLVNDLGEAGFDQVFAAGNSGPGDSTVLCPGAARYAVTVGATDHDKSIASFSSRGPCDDGTGSRICPDVVAVGVNVRSAVPGGYSTWSGTSMATPHVAGGVAVAEDAAKELAARELMAPGEHADYAPTYSEAEHLMKDCAQDLGESGPDNDYGWGFIQLDCVYQKVLERSRPIVTGGVQVGDPLLECDDSTHAVFTLANEGGLPAEASATLLVDGPENEAVSEDLVLGVGETATLSVPLSTSMAPGDYDVTASVTYSWENPANGETESDSLHDDAAFRVEKAVLEAQRPMPGQAGVGSVFQAGPALTNTGNAPAEGVHLVETIPPAYDIVPRVPGEDIRTVWSDPAPDKRVTRLNRTTYATYDVGDVGAGQTWDLDYRLVAEEPGEHQVTSDVTFSDHGACGKALTLASPQTVTATGALPGVPG